MMAVDFGKNILILVPHPDDEIVACCAAVGKAQKEGAKIFALYLTHGCVAREALWPWQRKKYDRIVARRRNEAEQVARFLGIAALNWPVRPARHLWQDMPCVAQEIKTAIDQNNIDQIWVPAFEGGNPDHDALNAISSALKHTVNVVEFAEYNYFGQKARSQDFPFPNGTEQIDLLSLEEEEIKREALSLYASEKGNLNYVKVEREAYRPLATYDYAKPPHEGKLWYTRFQWVPFKHPRVDFTEPQEVARAISDFLKKTT